MSSDESEDKRKTKQTPTKTKQRAEWTEEQQIFLLNAVEKTGVLGLKKGDKSKVWEKITQDFNKTYDTSLVQNQLYSKFSTIISTYRNYEPAEGDNEELIVICERLENEREKNQKLASPAPQKPSNSAQEKPATSTPQKSTTSATNSRPSKKLKISKETYGAVFSLLSKESGREPMERFQETFDY